MHFFYSLLGNLYSSSILRVWASLRSAATLSARQGGRGGNKKHFASNELLRTQQVRLLEDRFRCKTNKTPSDVSSHAAAFIRPEVVKLQKSKPKSLKVRRLRAVLLSALHIITACILGLLGEFSSYQTEAFIILASASGSFSTLSSFKWIPCEASTRLFTGQKVYRGCNGCTLRQPLQRHTRGRGTRRNKRSHLFSEGGQSFSSWVAPWSLQRSYSVEAKGQNP